MNNIEKITDILFDDKDLNLSIDQCEQIAELLDDNNIGDLQESKEKIRSYKHIIDCFKKNLHGNLDAQAKLADEARPNAAVRAANPEEAIDNIDYWIGGLWVEGYSPSSREVAKALIEYDLVKTPRPDDAAALEPTKWQLIAEDLEDKLENAEEKLKQAQDIVKLNVLKPTDDQEEKEVDTYEITTVLFDDFAAKNLDVVDLLADAIDNKYPSMDQKYMMFGKYIKRGKNAKGEDNEV